MIKVTRKDNYQKNLRKDFLLILILFLIILLYGGKLFWNYLNAEMIGGWDGASHYAISQYYSDHIFPRLYGWVPVYYAGMPFPLFYPPLFYFLVALGSKLFSIPVLLSFKILIIFLTISLPLLIYWLARKGLSFSQTMSFVIGLLGIHFIFQPTERAGFVGGPIEATFGSGLVTQLLGIWLFFLWLGFFLKIGQERKYTYLSILTLFLIWLSNPHIVILTFLVFLIFTLLRTFFSPQKIQVLKIHFLVLVISLGLAALWYFPFLAHYKYALTKTFPPLEFPILISLWIFLIIFGIIGSWFALKKKNLNLFAFSLCSLFFFIFALPIREYIPFLPLQPFRFIGIPFIFLSILSTYGIFSLSAKFFLTKWQKLIIILIFLFPFFYFTRPPHPFLGTYPLKHQKVDQLIEFMKQFKDGRSMVEVITQTDFREEKPKLIHSLPDHYTIAALLGASNQPTLWIVFRESSINSPFIQPLRNSFSFQHESFGVVCMLCDDPDNPAESAQEFYQQPIIKHIKRAQLFNLKYFILGHDKTVNNFNQLSVFFERLNKIGPWSIFKLKLESSYARIPDYYPTLVFTSLKTKDRPFEGLDAYDWLRLNEEWFFQTNFDILFALAKNRFLDKTDDLEKFKTALIIEYKYKNLDLAFEKLSNFAKENKLILFSSQDPLFIKLKEINNPNILIFEPKVNPREGVKELINLLDKIKIPLIENKNEKPKLIKAELEQEDIYLKLDKKPDKILPIYLSSTHFPLWQDLKGGETYLTSPVFTLIFTPNEEVQLKFKYHNIYNRLGIIFSIFSLLTFLFITLIEIRRNEK